MNKQLLLALAAGLILLLAGCTPKMRTSVSDASQKPLRENEEVIVLSVNQAVPGGCKLLGKLKLGDSGFSTDCNYSTVIEKAKRGARKAGGNIIKLTEVRGPGFGSTCYSIKADILYSADLPGLEKQVDAMQDSIAKAKFGTDPKFAILYVFRPKTFTGSAVSYDLHIGDSVTCKVNNNCTHTIKLYKEGKTVVWAKTESMESVSITVKFGEEYYIKCGVKTGYWVGVPEMNFLDKSQGRTEFLNVEGRPD